MSPLVNGLLKPSVCPLSWFPPPHRFFPGSSRDGLWLTSVRGNWWKGFRGSSRGYRRIGESWVGSPAKADASDHAVKLIWRTSCCCQALGTVARTTLWCSYHPMPPQLRGLMAAALPPREEPASHFSGSVALHSTSQASVSELRSCASASLRWKNSGQSYFPRLCLLQDARKRVQVLGHQEEWTIVPCGICTLGTCWWCMFSQKATLCLKLCVGFFDLTGPKTTPELTSTLICVSMCL